MKRAPILALVLAACAPARTPAQYGAELAACTGAAAVRMQQGATTKEQACQESIACENAVRARQNPPRQPRDASKGCE